MRKTRVLIVDDAVVVRRLLVNLLSQNEAVEVVGTAASGRLALTKISHLHPDLVLLDGEMPELSGLETLAAVRKTNPLLPVVMLGRSTPPGAVTMVQALALGANDYVTLPESLPTSGAAAQELLEQLLLKFKLLGFGSRSTEKAPAHPAPSPVPAPSKYDDVYRPRSPVDVVAIGSSTGGPNALTTLLSALPVNMPVPVLIVQHMPPMFTRFLAERLTSQKGIPVREAIPGEVLEPGQVWLAPGDYHLVLKQDGPFARLVTQQGPPENSCRPSVDVLFRSVADQYGSGVLAVILTGMGQDGLRGCERVRSVGGQVLVQDQASSVVWGMPGFVAQAGLAHRVLPLAELGPEIVRRVRQGRPSSLNRVRPA